MINTFSDIDSSWSLFLDRDGTINKRLPGRYVQYPEEFEFLPNALEGLYRLNDLFRYIFIVTNQQGIDKEIMTTEELSLVHQYMLNEIERCGGRIDNIYYCPHLAVTEPLCRKPNPGMALQAKKDYPEIDFNKCIMVGDMPSDILFGNRLGMKTVQIGKKASDLGMADFVVKDLLDLATHIEYNNA